jgi:SAM-dependent methyltransferase
MSEAVRRWRDRLAARSIPPRILTTAPETPYGFPAELFRHRAEGSTRVDPTPSTTRGLESLPQGGSLLDVGCGGGATSLPFAGRAGRVTGVDGQEDMLASFKDAWGEHDVAADTILATWPDVAPFASPSDLVVCGHVLYNVMDVAPFAAALDEHASRRVVLELTSHHPLAWMSDLWRRFHDLDLPEGPTADDAEEALRELGYAVGRDERVGTSDRGRGGFERRDDAIALVRRRLCLPADRDTEIADALGDRLGEHDGLWSVGPGEQRVVTLWWGTERTKA